ncbi:unnamed protein product [Brassica napus]|uniref:(rape) hypothetical protein n=1 Tax=Brassica napus TaxID=3708 RepID=A0A816KB93_BRANA|nr:unnamed protein product [Brassica napus]
MLKAYILVESCQRPPIRENIDELSCPPPSTKKKSGRPPTKRKRSVGEFGVPGSKSQSHKCSRCGTGGHNKSTCERPIG